MLMGASNLMMGLTIVLVICLAIVLGLVLVLLAELYCSIIIRRRHTTTTTTTSATINSNNTPSPPLTNFYTQSILSAPRSILYPDVGAGADIEKHPPVNQENGNSGRKDEGLMYISNPMFDDENGLRRSSAVAAGNTPFETPDSSPSRLETGSSEDGGDDDEVGEEVMSVKVMVETPPLTPMKKLPATVEGGGDLNTNINSSNNENEVSSTSSSGTPCTSSLSW